MRKNQAMWIYVPSTLPLLATLVESGAMDGSIAHSVTPELRAWALANLPAGVPAPDEEELEALAHAEAAFGALSLLSDDDAAPRRRVVLSAEVPDGVVTVAADVDEPGRVLVSRPIELREIRAAHIDGEHADTVVERYLKLALDEATEEAALEEAYEALMDEHLEWFDAAEL